MTTSTSDDPKAVVRRLGRSLGFDVCGVAAIEKAWPAAARLQEFIAAGRHGGMTWMETTAERRSHPARMWAPARSAVVVGLNYGPDHDPLEGLELQEPRASSRSTPRAATITS